MTPWSLGTVFDHRNSRPQQHAGLALALTGSASSLRVDVGGKGYRDTAPG